MADPNQPQQPDSGGLLSSLGKALPYAIPTVLGAALGGPMGAVAGLARGVGGDPELQMRRQEMAARWQELNLETQKAQLGLQNEQSYQDWVKGQPKDDQGMLRGLPPEARGQVLGQRIEEKRWAQTGATMKTDPEFLKHFGLTSDDVDVILKLPPSVGKPLLNGIMSAAKANNLQQVRFFQQQAIEAQKEQAAAGRQDKGIAAANARQDKALAAATAKATKAPSPSMLSNLATKAYNDALNSVHTGYVGTTVGASTADRKAAAMTSFSEQLTANGMDPDAAQELAEKYVAPKYEAARKAMPTPASAGARPSSVSGPPRAPKELWGKKHIKGGDGKFYDINSFGYPSLAGTK